MSATNQPSRLFVSSANSEYGQAGYLVNITLPEAILDSKGVECSRATIPNSLYPIPDYQNTFYFRYSNGTGNVPVKSLVLTNRRYFANPDELVAQLNLDSTAQNLSIIFSYNNITKRISFTAADPANHQNVFAPSYAAVLLPNLIRTKVIYICSNICIDDTLNANGALRNIIAKIPNNAYFGGLNIYEPIFPQYGRIISSTIQRIQITLLDENLQPYDLASEETWECEFQFRYN